MIYVYLRTLLLIFMSKLYNLYKCMIVFLHNITHVSTITSVFTTGIGVSVYNCDRIFYF